MIKVAAGVIMRDGKLLIAQRRGDDRLAYKWEFPGGKVESGETPEQCLARELMEEFGVVTQVGAFICATQHSYEHISIELLAYEVTYVSGEFCLHDHAAIRWVSPAELAAYDFAPADLPIVDVLRRRG